MSGLQPRSSHVLGLIKVYHHAQTVDGKRAANSLNLCQVNVFHVAGVCGQERPHHRSGSMPDPGQQCAPTGVPKQEKAPSDQA